VTPYRYHKLARRYHPDKQAKGGADEAETAKAAEKFKVIKKTSNIFGSLPLHSTWVPHVISAVDPSVNLSYR